MDGKWQLRDFLELGALPGAVPCARLHTRQVLWEWRLSKLSEDTELLVTELVTNAVAASRSIEQVVPVRLWLLSDRAQILILVQDSNPGPPERISPGDKAEHGRGLLLVDAISARWGWYFRQDTVGKTVWAVADLRATRE
jgi:anti-sigma regulatory factor (Ser/Thr protein kinase)